VIDCGEVPTYAIEAYAYDYHLGYPLVSDPGSVWTNYNATFAWYVQPNTNTVDIFYGDEDFEHPRALSHVATTDFPYSGKISVTPTAVEVDEDEVGFTKGWKEIEIAVMVVTIPEWGHTVTW
jgi:hypothetical protein